MAGTVADPYLAFTRGFFSRWAPAYDLFALPIAHLYRAAAARAAPEPGWRVLDVCTGTGELARRLARRGAVVTGVDITVPMLARARRKAGGGADFQLMDARRLAFPDGRFDAATLSLALHDMPRRAAVEALREMARVSRRRLVILDYELPRGPRWWRWLAFRFIDLFETPYFPRFVAEGVLPLLAEAGLPAPRETARPWPWLFTVHVVELAPPLHKAGG